MTTPFGSEYFIVIFLGIMFISLLLEFKTKIPYTITLVIIGIIISLLVYVGSSNNLNSSLANIQQQFKFDPKLIVNFVIPPLIFEAMMQVDYYRV